MFPFRSGMARLMGLVTLILTTFLVIGLAPDGTSRLSFPASMAGLPTPTSCAPTEQPVVDDATVTSNSAVTWAEFLEQLQRVLAAGPTPDWPPNAFEQALGVTAMTHVAAHYPRRYFEPTRPLLRAEAFMALAASLGIPPVITPNGILTTHFQDAAQIPAVTREGVAAALTQGLLAGQAEAGRLRPTEPITDAEVAILLCQAHALEARPPTQRPALGESIPAPTIPTTETRGVWLTNIDSEVLFSRQQLETALDRLAALNFNTVYPTVWNWGYTLFPSRVAAEVIGQQQRLYAERSTPALEAAQGRRDMLLELITLAHERGLAVIPWFEFGFMAPADYELARRHPEWFTQQGDGNPIAAEGQDLRRWLNPFHPQVQAFMLSLVNELMANYEVDGFQIDDHLGLPVEFGYDPYTVGQYQAEHDGRRPPTDSRDPEWLRWRADRISDFVGQLHRVVKGRRPEAVFSVAPNPYPFAYDHFLQDWPTWQRRGYVDEMIVQVYRQDLDRFVWELNRTPLQRVRSRIPTSIGILSGLKRRPIAMDWIRQQIDAIRDRTFAGMSFFFYETLWTSDTETFDQRYQALQAAFAAPARRPRP
ncbi:hypothetical protein XM38_012110 [Halomicronema hongdechloris C2206]|uniref:SLH domain-containing protein n=1 Tax=Halomicronema hongdechloris C2206 TaxID=1641165 RepID=A0A1Z3HIX5_9CYAN|nr:family 10 glycosylhydrolase [Halomicronema hongdechloris]ASC70274.1 hypothetical protein XM38_012110 [Halomicronema hongdechloris C2206]